MNNEYGHKPTVNTVSPMIGQELAKNAMKALIYAAIGIIIYVSLRFEWRMGLSSVLALLHDVFMIVALFTYFVWKLILHLLRSTNYRRLFN